ncbi:hypothetical protein NDU88_001582 [Pleurodeles waltl]|uniref:Uncharacterized protein n=1 Tax=Pleurodeles waltl TaxID=8319 RepID=A0AAV7M8L1_PLEWA|nr:hypothetical protein NDU88_001582 [Pleurodeles waltl]
MAAPRQPAWCQRWCGRPGVGGDHLGAPFPARARSAALINRDGSETCRALAPVRPPRRMARLGARRPSLIINAPTAPISGPQAHTRRGPHPPRRATPNVQTLSANSESRLSGRLGRWARWYISTQLLNSKNHSSQICGPAFFLAHFD